MWTKAFNESTTGAAALVEASYKVAMKQKIANGKWSTMAVAKKDA